MACDVDVEMETKLQIDCGCARKNNRPCTKEATRVNVQLQDDIIRLNFAVPKGTPKLKFAKSCFDVSEETCGKRML